MLLVLQTRLKAAAGFSTVLEIDNLDSSTMKVNNFSIDFFNFSTLDTFNSDFLLFASYNFESVINS